VHELGHFLMARRTGMRVDEFAIGFPPRLTSWVRGETRYSLNALPIGGYVKIFGEDAVDAVRKDGAENEAYSRSFVAKSPLAQALVLVAGVAMNMLLAWFLFIVVHAMGVPAQVEEAAATENARLVVSEVLADSPADRAGIPRGAVITELRAGTEADSILNISSFQAFTEDRPDTPLSVSYTFAGQANTVTVTPETGIVESEATRPAIGIGLALIDTVSRPFPEAVVAGTVQTVDTLVAVTVGISDLLFDTLLLRADLSGVAGPVGIVGLVEEASQFGLTALLLFTALISVNLAVINLLPFPALDGGRLLFVAIEVVKGSPINPIWVARLNTAGIILLLMLMVAVTYNDIARLLG
jgi:regulator of sigma E protease